MSNLNVLKEIINSAQKEALYYDLYTLEMLLKDTTIAREKAVHMVAIAILESAILIPFKCPPIQK